MPSSRAGEINAEHAPESKIDLTALGCSRFDSGPELEVRLVDVRMMVFKGGWSGAVVTMVGREGG